jgi:sensor histidine kinase YesM
MRRRVLLAFALWTLIGLSYATAMFGNAHTRGWPMTWSAALGWNLPQYYLWMVLSLLPMAVVRRFGFTLRALAIHIPLALALVVVHHVVFLTAYWRFGSPLVTRHEPLSLTVSLPWRIHDGLIIYALVVLALYAVHDLRRREALEAQLARAQLDALRAQLQPHFLFNTLTAISALTLSDPKLAKAMIAKLGEFLRITLDHRDDLAVPLRDELRLVELYAEIQQLRFRDRLTVTFDASEEALAVSVPYLVLQPLVENAFHHGLKSAGPHRVGVRGSRRDGVLVVEVDDDGDGLPATVAEGIGLRDTRARLRASYGDAATLELTARPGGGTRATLSVPCA